MTSGQTMRHELLVAWIESTAAAWIIRWLQGIPLVELAALVRRNADLAEQLPTHLPIPDHLRGAVAEALARMGPDSYERIRLRIGSRLPEHAALLGLDSSRQWYHRTMDRLRQRVCAAAAGEGPP